MFYRRKVRKGIVRYNDIWIIIVHLTVGAHLKIGHDVTLESTSVGIHFTSSDLSNSLSSEVSSEVSLNLDNQGNFIRLFQPLIRIIEVVSLDIIRVYFTLSTTSKCLTHFSI